MGSRATVQSPSVLRRFLASIGLLKIAVFDTVADMTASSFMVPGQRARTLGNAAAGDGGGGEYDVVAAQSVDGFGDHLDAAGNALLLRHNGTVDVRQFGAMGSGDDAPAVQAAAAVAKELLLYNHTFNSGVSLGSSIKIRPVGVQSVITPGFDGRIFSSTADKVDVAGIKVAGDNTLLYQSDDFDSIEVHECEFTGAVDATGNYLLETAFAGVTGKSVNVHSNILKKCTAVFADNLVCGQLRVSGNEVDEPTQWVVRCLDQTVSGDSPETIYCLNNEITNFNGDLTDKSVVARSFQVAANKVSYVQNNVMDTGESTTASNLVYLRNGSLVCTGNRLKNIKGNSSTSLIDDKTSVATGAVHADHYWFVAFNEFDQRGIAYADENEAAIRVNQAHNVMVCNNKFRGLKRIACRFYHSLDLGLPPENVSFVDNEIYDHEYPVVCQIYQNIKNASVCGNKVFKISNPSNHSEIGRTECRLLDIYQSFNNGADIEGVEVKSNVVYDTPSMSFLVHIYRNASAPTADIVGVCIAFNEMKAGTNGYLVRFTAPPAGQVDLIGNIGPSGMGEVLGAAPAMRSYYNVLAGVALPVSVTGAKGGNAALGNLMTELASRGLVVDNTSA